MKKTQETGELLCSCLRLLSMQGLNTRYRTRDMTSIVLCLPRYELARHD